MTRIKTVYPTDMVCHLWSNRHTHDIKNAGDNVYTRGAALYSYGSHHVIGAFLDTPAKGAAPILLWNDDTYGMTTARHHSHAWRALDSLQRLHAVTVPGMRDNDITPHGLQGLAMACVKAAVKPLESSKKARENRPHHIARAQMFFDSARKIYTYLGDKKAGASVPTLSGADTSQVDVLAVLQAINKAEYIKAAQGYYMRAQGTFSQCQSAAEWHAQGIERPHNRGTARAVCTYGADTVRLCEAAIFEFKKAAVNVPPAVRQLKAKGAAIVDAHTAQAKAENIRDTRNTLARDYTMAYQAFTEYKRGGTSRRLNTGLRLMSHGSSRSLGYTLERITYPEPTEYAALWPSEKTRAAQVSAWLALQARARRTLAMHHLQSSIESAQATIAAYESEPSARYVTVPSATYTRAALRAAQAIYGGTAPAYWVNLADTVAREADTLAQAHSERLQALEADKIKAWRAGERVSVSRDIPPMVRIMGNTLETSYGASVPLEHAARLIRIAQRVARAGGMTYAQGTGPKVGHFTTNHIGADMSAIIGCHTFTASEAAHAAALIDAENVPMAAESTNG